MKHSALRRDYVDPGHRPGPVSGQTIILAALVVVVIFVNKAVDVLGTDTDVLVGATATLVAIGGTAGAFFHPVRRFWWRGSISGIMVAAGAFAAHRLYSRWRPDPFGHEFAAVALVGALPGVALYYLLMRGQTVASAPGRGDGEIRWINPATLQAGPIRHELGAERRDRIAKLHERLHPIDGWSLEKRVDLFARDLDPDREIAICERIVLVCERAYADLQPLTLGQKREIYALLMVDFGAPVDEVLKRHQPRTITLDQARHVLSISGAPRAT